jgi:hypothetical protein
MATKRKPLRLYVWEGVLTDHSSGVMFALASSPDAARRVIVKAAGDYDTVHRDLAAEPMVVSRTKGFAVWGGG